MKLIVEMTTDERDFLLMALRMVRHETEHPTVVQTLREAVVGTGWEFGEMNAMGGVWPIKPDISPELWANTPIERRRKRRAPGPWLPLGEGEQC